MRSESGDKGQKQRPSGFRKIEATTRMKKVMADYFLDLDAAARDPGRKVAWCSSVGPAELLHAFGFAVYYPENHSAMLGATRTATDLIPHANAMGYSPDICSYLTADVGAFLKGFTPLTRAYGIETVPTPDVLIFNTNQCRDVQDWFMWYSRHFGVPCIGVETHRGIGEVTVNHLNSVASQMKALIPEFERISGHAFDMDRFRDVVELSRRTSVLWEEVLRCGMARPSPLTFFEGTIHMGPAVCLRGTRIAVEYYELLLKELKKRIDDGIGAVEDERYRLYWEGMPIWGRLRDLGTHFMMLKTCVAASTYCNSWIFNQLDPEKPFKSMARAYTELFIVRTDEVKERYIRQMVEEYSLDGILFHDAKTCPYNSNSRYGMPQRLEAEFDIPYLIVNGDLNDLRCYSDEQARTSIEAFIEQLAELREEAGGKGLS
jgi:benzoyl-CoA reductase/2-hydroxyglutaryl-CoA dehydratase subunit BcrC/BadD/HgdB